MDGQLFHLAQARESDVHRVPKPADMLREYYRPKQRCCPACKTRLRRHQILWRKSLVLLTGQVYVTSWGYRCPNPDCSASAVIHRSTEAEQLYLGRRQFGRDVIVQVGYWRFWQHATVTEIHERLHTELGLPIAERQVLDLLADFLALLRAAQPAKIAALRPQLAQRDGLVVAIDGMQPEKGNLCLYVLREPRLRLTLLTESLEESSAPNLRRELLDPLKALAHTLNLPILGVVSDAQESIRLAVATALPGVPHQSCHFHCLRDAGDITFQTDRSLKTALKKALRRPLASVAARLRRLPTSDPFQPILVDYADAIRSTLLEGGVAPFELGGIRVVDDLTDLAASLLRCREKGGIRSWNASCALLTNASPLSSNATSWLGSSSGSLTWSASSTRLSRRLAVRRWPRQWIAIWSTWWRPSVQRATNWITKWRLTSTRPSASGGGVCSPATRSRACHAPTTS